MSELPEINDEAMLLLFKIFSKCTGLFVQGDEKALKIFIDTYRKINGFKEGSILFKQTPYTIHGECPDKAWHIAGNGLSGISKLTATYGLKWKFEAFNHPKIKESIKITIDIEKNMFVFIKHPLGNCENNKCNGNPNCTFNHPKGFFSPVEKKVKKED